MMFALWTAVTFLRRFCPGVVEGIADDAPPCRQTLIGLIETPVPPGGEPILRSVETRLMYSINSAVSGLPASNSTPA